MKKVVIGLFGAFIVLLAGAIPVTDFYRASIFKSPIFYIILLGLALTPLFFQFKKRRWDKQIGYILAHYGLVLVFVGVVLEYTPLKEQGNIQLVYSETAQEPHAACDEYWEWYALDQDTQQPVYLQQIADEELQHVLDFMAKEEITIYSQTEENILFEDGSFLMKQHQHAPASQFTAETSSFADKTGKEIQLPFSVKIENAEIEYYPSSTWNLFKIDFQTQEPTFVKEVESAELDKKTTPLIEEGKNFRYFEDGTYYELNEKPKEYRAYLKFEGEEKSQLVRVNHPFTKEGYRFFLMAMSPLPEEPTKTVVQLLVRKNPGSTIVLIGFFTCIAGFAILFASRPKKEEDNE